MEMNLWESTPGPTKAALAMMEEVWSDGPSCVRLAPVHDTTRRRIEQLSCPD